MPVTKSLSEHFVLAEAEKSQTATRKGIVNKAPDDIIPAIQLVARKVLEPIRSRFGPFSPSSWYRSPELNAAIGGAKSSQHMKGEAVDIEVPGVSNIDLARWILEHLDFDQLILEFWHPADPKAGWVHVSFTEKNRGEVLTVSKIGTFRGLPK